MSDPREDEDDAQDDLDDSDNIPAEEFDENGFRKPPNSDYDYTYYD